ncbi:MAG: hypothetical protein GY866_43010 [Proteobacteria bacterium]|nr:hypothetical protein [Pseudomonadota bacterium]
MKNLNTAGNRFVKKKNGIFGPVDPLPADLEECRPEDLPGVPKVYFDVADMWGPRFGGPPLSVKWMAVLRHLFTEDEALMFLQLRGARAGKTATDIAEAVKRPVEEVGRILDVLTDEKRILLSSMKKKGSTSGSSEYVDTSGKRIELDAEQSVNRRYFVQPILPGAWETIVVTQSMDAMTDWHRKFIELFIPVYETGYTTIRRGERPAGIRYLPVGQSIENNSVALPSDKLGPIFDRFKDLAVGLCQCRVGTEVLGDNCGRPMENCIAMGPLAVREIEAGDMRRINVKEAMEIKAEAEASGLVSWTWTTEVGGSNSSCSCCGCCCMYMRAVSQFAAPGAVAPPHFMPEVDEKKCVYCGKCAKACPMGAWIVNVKGKARKFDSVRCIGCGLCYVACDKEKAVELKAVEGYQVPMLKNVEGGADPLEGISGVREK